MHGYQVVDIIPLGLELLISEHEATKLDQPLISNPNVGGFGQGDPEIINLFRSPDQGRPQSIPLSHILNIYKETNLSHGSYEAILASDLI